MLITPNDKPLCNFLLCMSVPLFWILAKLRYWISQSFSFLLRTASFCLSICCRRREPLIPPSASTEKQHLWAHRVSVNFRNKFFRHRPRRGFINISQFSVTNIMQDRDYRTHNHTIKLYAVNTHTSFYKYFFLLSLFLGDICFCVYLLRTHSLRHANKAPLITFRCSQ